MTHTTKLGVGILSLCLITTVALAGENIQEKAVVLKNELVRSVKRTAHLTQELTCTKGDAACLVQRAKNRLAESADVVTDKADELKNKAD